MEDMSSEVGMVGQASSIWGPVLVRTSVFSVLLTPNNGAGADGLPPAKTHLM